MDIFSSEPVFVGQFFNDLHPAQTGESIGIAENLLGSLNVSHFFE
jgi:hypothetical protein